MLHAKNASWEWAWGRGYYQLMFHSLNNIFANGHVPPTVTMLDDKNLSVQLSHLGTNPENSETKPSKISTYTIASI